MPDLPKSPLPSVLPKKVRRKDSAVYRLFSPLERWYDSIGHAGRDRVDQSLHFLAGFALGFLLPGWASWAICHRREFVMQAPIERIDDTEKDMRFWLIGTACGWATRQGMIAAWIARALT